MGKCGESQILQLDILSEKSHIIKLVNGLLLKAVKMRATDIHIEPFKDKIQVRFRIDGVLPNIKSLPKSALQGITSRTKIMGEMDISERRIPQDGGFRAQFNKDMMIDLRVNTLPGIHGEKMVLRIISKAELRSTVSELGFSRLLEIVITKETHFQIIEREGEIVGRKIKFILDKGQE